MKSPCSPRVGFALALVAALSTEACAAPDTAETDSAEAVSVEADGPLVSMGLWDPSAPGAFVDDPRDTTPFETSTDSTTDGPAPTAADTVNAGNGINYHGGPVLPYVSVYLIIYGNWLSSTTGIIEEFIKGLGQSHYWAINHGYSDESGHVVGGIKLAGTRHDNYSRGKHLDENDIIAIVNHSIDEGFPAIDHGLYMVLTAKDVNFPGYCNKECGHHSWFTRHTGLPIFGTTTHVKYAVIGNANRCLSDCAAQQYETPNGNLGADSAVSIIAHEAEETATDPLISAWFNRTPDKKLHENADKCEWTFGKVYYTANGAMANMAFGGRNWLVQRNWVNAKGGYCARRP